MTTTITRGTKRPAAEARRTKHAQRTPLPGDRVPNTLSDNLETLGMPELRQLAMAQGWSTLTKSSKATIVKTLRENPNGAPAVAQQAVPWGSISTEASNVDVIATDEHKSSDSLNSDEVSQRIAGARERGYSRKDIADLSGLTQSVIWRMQTKKRVKVTEHNAIATALMKIESGEVEPTKRGRPVTSNKSAERNAKHAAIRTRVVEVRDALAAMPQSQSKDAVVVRYRAALESALTALDTIEW